MKKTLTALIQGAPPLPWGEPNMAPGENGGMLLTINADRVGPGQFDGAIRLGRHAANTLPQLVEAVRRHLHQQNHGTLQDLRAALAIAEGLKRPHRNKPSSRKTKNA